MIFSKCKSAHIINFISPSSPMAFRIQTIILKITLQLIFFPLPISITVLQLHLASFQYLDDSCFCPPQDLGPCYSSCPEVYYTWFVFQLAQHFLREILQCLSNLEVLCYALTQNDVPLLQNTHHTVGIQSCKSHKSAFDHLMYTKPSTVSGT